MSIAEDIKVLEEALDAVLCHEENTGEGQWVVASEMCATLLHKVDRDFIEAASPARIKRLVEALKAAQSAAWGGALLRKESHDAKLTRALELLKDASEELYLEGCRVTPAQIDAFLKEVSGE